VADNKNEFTYACYQALLIELLSNFGSSHALWSMFLSVSVCVGLWLIFFSFSAISALSAVNSFVAGGTKNLQQASWL
jgi:hypothetical protein